MKDKIQLTEEQRKNIDEQLTSFLFLCSKEDARFFDLPRGERTAEEYARFICIGMVFELYGAVIRLLADCEREPHAENFAGEVLAYIAKLDFAQVDGWMRGFIDKIQGAELKKYAAEVWQEKKAGIDAQNFSLKDLK